MTEIDLTTPAEPVEAVEPVAPAATSRWEDFIDIFYAPASVYARRAASGPGLPIVVVTLLVGGIFFANSGAMQPIMDAEFQRAAAGQMAKNPQITPEMMERGRGFAQTFAKIIPFVFLPIAMLLTGVALWLCGKVVGAVQPLRAALMVAAFAYVPKVLEAVLNGVQLLVLDPAGLNGRYKLSLGIGRMLDPDTASPLVLALLGRVDLFTLWVTLLCVIGLSVTGRITRDKAAAAGVMLWVVGALPGLLQALRQ